MGKWTEAQRAKYQATMKKKFGTRYKGGEKISMGQMKSLAKTMVGKAKRSSPRVKSKETSIIINGWRVTLGKHEIRIEEDE